jgi:hypothetical protein
MYAYIPDKSSLVSDMLVGVGLVVAVCVCCVHVCGKDDGEER